MTSLLHLDASARPGALSRRVGQALADEFRARDATADYTYRDLAADPVPHITHAWTEICDNLMRDRITDLSLLHLGARTAGQKEAWQTVEPLLAELVDADVVLIATPMYNYSVPSSLKAWIDQVTFPRMNLGARRFVVVASRGGSYVAGSPKAAVEHQVRYLTDFVVGHFGVAEPAVIVVELANARVDPLLEQFLDDHTSSLNAAIAAARRLGAQLAGGGDR